MMYGFGGDGALRCLGFGGGTFHLMPLLLLILILGLATLAVVLLVRKNRPAANAQALEILSTRFASGELTEEEYLSRKKVLKS